MACCKFQRTVESSEVDILQEKPHRPHHSAYNELESAILPGRTQHSEANLSNCSFLTNAHVVSHDIAARQSLSRCEPSCGFQDVGGSWLGDRAPKSVSCSKSLHSRFAYEIVDWVALWKCLPDASLQLVIVQNEGVKREWKVRFPPSLPKLWGEEISSRQYLVHLNL